MPYLAIVAFEQADTSGGSVWHYRAYSSNDPERSRAKLLRDVHQFIGYQPTHPSPIPATEHGFFRFEYIGSNNMTYVQRSQGILFVQMGDCDINDDYTPVNRDDRHLLLEAGADDENIVECSHYIVPEANYPEHDNQSDNNSTDSEDSD